MIWSMILRFFLVFLTLGPALVGCTKLGGFFDLLSKGREAAPEPSGTNAASAQDVLKAMQGLALAVDVSGMPTPMQRGILCDKEVPNSDTVRVEGDKVLARYEANGSPCAADGVGFVTFSYDLDCKGEPAGPVADVKSAARFFAHHSYDFAGDLEKRCLKNNGGFGAYKIESVRSMTNFRIAYHASCNVVPTGLDECKFTNEYREGKESVLMTVAARNLVIEADKHYIVSGSMTVEVNNWKGSVTFRGGVEPPVAAMTDGKSKIKITMSPAMDMVGQ